MDPVSSMSFPKVRDLSILQRILFLLVAIPLTIWWAFAFSRLWDWFVVPFLHVPAMSMFSSVGFGFLMSLARGSSNDSELDVVELVARDFLRPGTLLLLGYLLHLAGAAAS